MIATEQIWYDSMVNASEFDHLFMVLVTINDFDQLSSYQTPKDTYKFPTSIKPII